MVAEIAFLFLRIALIYSGYKLIQNMMRIHLIALLGLLGLLHLGCSVSFQSLFDRELKSTYGFEILKHYHSEQFGGEDVKHFKGESMLFMTPWRENGVPLALKYIRKFDYFAPCYYDFKKKDDQIQLDVNKYDQDYLKQIKLMHPNIKITPRLFVSGIQGDVFFLASTKEDQYSKLMNFTEQIVNNPLYDGIIYSSPFLTPNHQYPFSIKSFLKDVKALTMRANKTLLITMDGVNPNPQQRINKKKAKEIIEIVDKVIVTNYDCPRSNQGVNIPISPMDWIKQNYDYYCEISSKAKITPKLIMAIPLYGYYVSMLGKYDPIDGKELLGKLNSEKKAWMSWNEDFEECMIYLNQMEFLYFPCLHFYHNRLRYFESIGVGVAAFQIGSGLELFMQMF